MPYVLENIIDFLKKFWYLILIAVFLIAVIIFFLLVGEDSMIAIHDNLDLFIPQFMMMKNDNSFFLMESGTDFLNGISRNVLPSEFYLGSIVYMIFPAYKAYIVCYILKVVIATGSGLLLAYDVYEHEGLDKWTKKHVYYVRPQPKDPHAFMAASALAAFGYGIVNLFPTFGIAFASMPLLIFYLRKVRREPHFVWFILIFFYPVLSYFSYFGLFIIGYIFLSIFFLWISSKEFPWTNLLAMIILAIGYALCEYRLFGMMLFSDEVTIRSTIKIATMTPLQATLEGLKVFAGGMMHADDAHMYIILPVCIIYFFVLNIGYMRDGNPKGIFHDYFNLSILGLVFNSAVYGLYYVGPVRAFFDRLIPPLAGWQWNRTVFFNPFLWYMAFGIVLCRIAMSSGSRDRSGSEKLRMRLLAAVLGVAALFAVLAEPMLPFGSGARYNDIYYTLHSLYYRSRHDGQGPDSLSYREFYDTELFDKIKSDIHYTEGEQAVAYGLYPAQLEYNDISTLDGYLGFYSQEYKDKWRKVIAPALELMPESAAYFDNSGIRCYLYSGTEAAIPMYTRSLGGISAEPLYIDNNALCDLGCKYVFSRIEITNTEDVGLTLVGDYEGLAYKLYVYELSRLDMPKESED
ncbi:DUF6044 family protein [Butyrivibrio sp. MC2013]|uniref:DUF6044 family protein n=1 Tax=Butyrivibrio sp. MC2013 TaxID=1280686 RepID=UPI00047B1ADC|nr:DUF6044 family protein [Butyrivibrio sp. MC2013]